MRGCQPPNRSGVRSTFRFSTETRRETAVARATIRNVTNGPTTNLRSLLLFYTVSLDKSVYKAYLLVEGENPSVAPTEGLCE